jgi:hypothetical protein
MTDLYGGGRNPFLPLFGSVGKGFPTAHDVARHAAQLRMSGAAAAAERSERVNELCSPPKAEGVGWVLSIMRIPTRRLGQLGLDRGWGTQIIRDD